jgi:tryptophan synthase beta chain
MRRRREGHLSDQNKYTMGEDRIPHTWYNLTADLPAPPPPVLHPGTGQPIGPADLAPLFPMALIGQEVSAERHIEIPGPVRDISGCGARPRSIARTRSKRSSALPRAFSTNMRA